MALESGSRLGPYEIVGLLASGAMGDVYRARDPRLEREVAIKVVAEEIADRKQLRRFEQEARAAGALNHPNVLAVHDVGTHDGTPYVVSELLEGHTLRARLEGGALPSARPSTTRSRSPRPRRRSRQGNRPPRSQARQRLRHERRPDQDPRLRPRQADAPDAARSRRRPRHQPKTTESGVVLGTVGFMSPEQVRGKAVDQRSDIFSFGACCTRCSGSARVPTRQRGRDDERDPEEDPPEVSRTGRGISPGVARLVSRCLEKRAGDRFQSAHDLALALEAVSSGVSAPSDEEGRRSGVARAVSVTKRYKKALLVTGHDAAGGSWPLPGPRPLTSTGRGRRDRLAGGLPFENVGGDADREYLSDGVAEALLNALSRLPDLKVIARSTSFRFRGKEVDPRQVGRESR